MIKILNEINRLFSNTFKRFQIFILQHIKLNIFQLKFQLKNLIS